MLTQQTKTIPHGFDPPSVCALTCLENATDRANTPR